MNIMTAVDLTHEAKEVVERAIPWAVRLGGKVHLRTVSSLDWGAVSAFGGENQMLASEWARWREEEAQALTELNEMVPEPMRGTCEVLTGPPGPALVREAAGFDAAILGTHGRRGVERAFLGSVAERVVRRAPIPVFVVPLAAPPIASTGPLKVVLPMAARYPEIAAAKRIHAWLGLQAEMVVVHALMDLTLSQELGIIKTPITTVEDHPHTPMARQRIKNVFEQSGLPPAPLHFILATGVNPAAEVIKLAESEGADLIAMPTHGRRGMGRVAFGSVTERVVRLSTMACCVVR